MTVDFIMQDKLSINNCCAQIGNKRIEKEMCDFFFYNWPFEVYHCLNHFKIKKFYLACV